MQLTTQNASPWRTHKQSNRCKIGSVSSTFSARVRDGSYRPPIGFAAATTAHLPFANRFMKWSPGRVFLGRSPWARLMSRLGKTVEYLRPKAFLSFDWSCRRPRQGPSLPVQYLQQRSQIHEVLLTGLGAGWNINTSMNNSIASTN